MNNTDIRNRLIYIFYWLGIVCEFTVSFSGYVTGGYHEPVIIMAGMGFFLLTILTGYDYKNIFSKSSLCELAVYILIAVYGLLCYKAQHSALVLRIGLALIASRIYGDKELVNKVIKLFFYGTLLVMALSALLSAMGLHGQFSIYQNFRHVPETRYCFGFYHPNGFALFYIRLALMAVYLFADKIKCWLSPLIFIICSAPLLLAKSKMALAAYALMALLAILYTFLKNKIKVVSIVTFAVAITEYICGILLLILTYQGNLYDNTPKGRFFIFLNDEIMTGRLTSMIQSFEKYKVNAFGYGNVLVTSENGFVSSLFSEGLILLIIMLAAFLYLYIRMYKNKDIKGMIVLICVFAYLIAESFAPYFNKNLLWMMAIGYLSISPSNSEKDA